MTDRRTLLVDGQHLRALREQKGWSRDTFLELLHQRSREGDDHITHFTLSTLKRLERGGRAMASSVRAAAALLGVPIEAIAITESTRGSVRGEVYAPGNRGESNTSSAARAPAPVHALALAPHRLVDQQARWRLYCMDVYRRIVLDEARAVRQRVMPAKEYWAHFWDHQRDQFRLWRDGLLDDATYADWLAYRPREYRDNMRLCGMTYRQGWRAYCEWCRDTEFAEFMDGCFRSHTRHAMAAVRGKIGEDLEWTG
jgi:transcriptional regulator with XRE-family HTH domain